MNRIAELKRKRAALFTKMNAFLVEKDSDDDAPMSDDDKRSYSDMCKQLDDHDERIARLEGLDAKAAEESEEVKGDEADEDEDKGRKSGRSNLVIKHSHDRRREPKGTMFARFIVGAGLAKGANSLEFGRSYVADKLGDPEVAKALVSNTQAGGGATIPQDFRADLIDLLTAEAVVRKIGAQTIPMPMGNLTLPTLTAGSQATWIGEDTDIGVSQQAWGNLNLSAKKLAGLVPVSNDLVRRSPMAVEAIVRADMARQLALAEDSQFLAGTPSAAKPNSLVSMAAFTKAVTVAGLADANNLLEAMFLDLQTANVSTSGAVWIGIPALFSYLKTLTDSTGRYFFKDELDQGKLLGCDVHLSTQLPGNLGGGNASQLFLVQPAHLIIGDTLSMIADSSSEAPYNGISTFQRDETVFRVIEEVDFNTRYKQAISVATVTGARPSFAPAGTFGVPYYVGNTSATGSAAPSANPSGQ